MEENTQASGEFAQFGMQSLTKLLDNWIVTDRMETQANLYSKGYGPIINQQAAVRTTAGLSPLLLIGLLFLLLKK